MSIEVIRIDDRYIHGQVTVSWVNRMGIEEIWVVDDKIAKNPLLKSAQLLMAPPNKKVEILSIDECVKMLQTQTDRIKMSKIMIVIPTPQICLQLLEKVKIIDVNWINVGQSSWKEGKTRIVKSFSVDKDDAEAFKKIHLLGYSLVYKMLADDKPLDFYKLLEEKNLI